MRDRSKYFQNQETDEFDEMYRRLSVAHGRIEELEQKLHRRQVHGTYIDPTLQNGWAQPAPPLEPFAYRIWSGNLPEFKGHLDASGASSGTVAFTIPVGPDDMVLPHDVYHPEIIFSGSTLRNALVKIDSTTGEVSIFWPVT